jgi:hypothetical protein
VIEVIVKRIMANKQENFHNKIYNFLTQQQTFALVCNIIELYLAIQGREGDKPFEEVLEMFTQALDSFED